MVRRIDDLIAVDIGRPSFSDSLYASPVIIGMNVSPETRAIEVAPVGDGGSIGNRSVA
jgi:hypothetical protein